MTTVLITGLATACVLTAVEGLLVNLGKWRGLLALSFSIIGCLTLGVSAREAAFYILAATFVGLTASLVVEQTFTGISIREMRGLPKRIDRM
jgi:hypothetical protein